MNREVEADGFITRSEDTAQNKKSCVTCRWYQYSIIVKAYVCVEGNRIHDWSQEHEDCDKWKK